MVSLLPNHEQIESLIVSDFSVVVYSGDDLKFNWSYRPSKSCEPRKTYTDMTDGLYKEFLFS